MNKDFGIEAIETIIATIKGGETTVGDRSAYIIAGYPGDIQGCNKVLKTGGA